MDTSLRSTACGRPFSATHKLTATPGGSQPFPLQTVIVSPNSGQIRASQHSALLCLATAFAYLCLDTALNDSITPNVISPLAFHTARQADRRHGLASANGHCLE